MAQNHKIKVGITQGDINGIGYEVILKTLSDSRITEMCTPVVYGSPKVMAYHRKALDFPPINFNIAADASSVLPSRVNIINCMGEEVRVELSKSTPQGGEAAYLALEAAVADMEKGLIDVLVTAPINKNNIQSESFSFPGHTEYLQDRTEDATLGIVLLNYADPSNEYSGNLIQTIINNNFSFQLRTSGSSSQSNTYNAAYSKGGNAIGWD